MEENKETTRAAELRLYLLGTPRIERNGEPASTDRRKAVALLVYLAVTGRAHSREALAALFWPDYAPASAFAYLRRTLWEIHQMVGEGWLEADREQVQLCREQGFWLDVDAFQAALATLDQAEASAETVIMRLAAAAELYRDDFLAGFSLRDCPAFDEWQLFQTEALRHQLAALLDRLVTAYAQRNAMEEALAAARRRLSLDELDEAAHRTLMQLYAATGQRGAAVRQYELCVETLRRELGAEPAPLTTALYDQIRRGVLTGADGGSAGPLAGILTSLREDTDSGEADHRSDVPIAGQPRLQLPTPPTPFVGRRRSLEQLALLLAEPDRRLVTLIGPGGSGKTRLAIEAVRELVQGAPGEYPDGGHFVGLAPLAASAALVPAVAKALGFTFFTQEDTPPRGQLLDFLRDKRLVLLLDNFEHLINEENVGFVAELLALAPGIKVVVTTRTRLNLQGEHLFPVGGLSIPGAAELMADPDIEAISHTYSAIQLFAQAARRVSAGFTVTKDNLADIVAICTRVEGMPLAIELAAAWTEVLTTADIAAEVARGLDFLESEWRDLPERQRSLRAVFNTSWQLLSPQEQAAYLRLAVFRGGFSRDAAHHVAGVTLPQLLALVNKSWLQRDIDGRFQVHELLRQFAEELLRRDTGAWQEANHRHASYFCAFARTQTAAMRGPYVRTALETVAADLDNVRTAWSWLVHQDEMDILIRDLLPCLYHYSRLRGAGAEQTALVRDAMEVLAAQDQGAPEHLAILLTAQSWYAIEIWLHPAPFADVRKALQIADQLDDPLVLDFWYEILVSLAATGWEDDSNIDRLERLVPRVRAQGDQWRLAHALTILGELANSTGRYDRAREVLAEALAIGKALGNLSLQATALFTLGIVSRNQERGADAVAQLLTSRQIFLELGDKGTAAFVTWLLAESSIKYGEFTKAFQYFDEVKAMYTEVGNRHSLSSSLNYEGFQALRYGDIGHAKQARAGFMALCEELKDPVRLAWGHWEWGEIHRVEGKLEAALAEYELAQAAFARHNVQTGLAFYWRGRGDVAFAQRDFVAAAEHFQDALSWAQSAQHSWGQCYILARLGHTAVCLDQLETGKTHLVAALRLALQRSFSDLAMVALLGLAHLLIRQGDLDRGRELATYVFKSFQSWNETKAQAQALLASLPASSQTMPADLHPAMNNSSTSEVVAAYLPDLLDIRGLTPIAAALRPHYGGGQRTIPPHHLRIDD